MTDEIKVPEEETAARRETVGRYFNDFLREDPETGLRSTSGIQMQNWWESVQEVVAFYGDEFKGGVVNGEDHDRAIAQQRKLLDEIQESLGEGNKLSEAQVDIFLGGVRPEQFDAIVDAVAGSDLPLYSKSPEEKFDEALKEVMKSD